METAFTFLLSGIVLGLVAGVSPGPLLTLVISETIKHNKWQGIKVAIAPLITDVALVLISIFLFVELSASSSIIGLISLLGAAFLCYLAYESLTFKGLSLNMQKIPADSLKKGIITNVLSPHPWLFWITVGASLITSAYAISLFAAALFVFGFYICLVGSKIVIALIVDRSKDFLKSSAYLWIIRILGAVLIVYALIFVKEGLVLLGPS